MRAHLFGAQRRQITCIHAATFRRWVDAGKFLTGFSAVGSIAIPAILFHAEKITGGALAMELAAVAVLAGTAFAFEYLSNDEGSYYY